MNHKQKESSPETPKVQDKGNKQKPVKVDLSLDLIRLPKAPDKAAYYSHTIGEQHTVKSGKNKGKTVPWRNNKIALPTVKSLSDAGVKDPQVAQANMGLSLKHQVTAAVNQIDRDNRIICTGMVHSVDSQGMARMAVGFKQTTAQKLLASLLAHGVPPAEAKAFAEKYD
jgi:hypothetical protein